MRSRSRKCTAATASLSLGNCAQFEKRLRILICPSIYSTASTASIRIRLCERTRCDAALICTSFIRLSRIQYKYIGRYNMYIHNYREPIWAITILRTLSGWGKCDAGEARDDITLISVVKPSNEVKKSCRYICTYIVAFVPNTPVFRLPAGWEHNTYWTRASRISGHVLPAFAEICQYFP